VNDRFNIVSFRINCEMHADFAGDSSRACNLVAFEIDDDHVGRSQQALAGSGGRGEQPLLIEPHRKIARRAGHKAKAI
jgi:hypothetical protein